LATPARGQTVPAPGLSDRAVWVGVLRRLADPVLNNLAKETLKTRMPVEEAAGAGRASVTHLEALGRLVAGIAPWLELAADESEEGRLRAKYADVSRWSTRRSWRKACFERRRPCTNRSIRKRSGS
jgi:Uncharacterized protein conserved in bacteria (DUF2264)